MSTPFATFDAAVGRFVPPQLSFLEVPTGEAWPTSGSIRAGRAHLRPPLASLERDEPLLGTPRAAGGAMSPSMTQVRSGDMKGRLENQVRALLIAHGGDVYYAARRSDDDALSLDIA